MLRHEQLYIAKYKLKKWALCKLIFWLAPRDQDNNVEQMFCLINYCDDAQPAAFIAP